MISKLRITKKKTIQSKKKIDENSIDLFRTYLYENNLHIFLNHLSYEVYKIRKASIDEKHQDHLIARVLEVDITKISNQQSFINFIKYCFVNNHHDVGYHQILIKTPRTTDFSFSQYIHDVIDIMATYNEESLFKYFNRVGFLNSSFDFLDYALKKITQEKYKIDIFKSIFKTNKFNSADNQKYIYSIMTKYISNKSEFKDKFTKIILNPDFTDVIDTIEEPYVIKITMDKEKLISANLFNSIGGQTLISIINEHSNYLKNNFPKLEISNTYMTYDKQRLKHELYIFCSKEMGKLNKKIFNKMINNISTLNSQKEISSTIINYEEIVNKESIIFLHDTINSMLPENQDKIKNNRKI